MIRVLAFRAFVIFSVLVIAAGCGSTRTVTKTVTVSGTTKSGVGAPNEQVLYG